MGNNQTLQTFGEFLELPQNGCPGLGKSSGLWPLTQKFPFNSHQVWNHLRENGQMESQKSNPGNGSVNAVPLTFPTWLNWENFPPFFPCGSNQPGIKGNCRVPNNKSFFWPSPGPNFSAWISHIFWLFGHTIPPL